MIVARSIQGVGAAIVTPLTVTLIPAPDRRPRGHGPIAGLLSDRLGGRRIVAIGVALQAIGIGWLAAELTATTLYADLIAPFLIAGAGLGFFFAPITRLTLRYAPEQLEGIAFRHLERATSARHCAGCRRARLGVLGLWRTGQRRPVVRLAVAVVELAADGERLPATGQGLLVVLLLGGVPADVVEGLGLPGTPARGLVVPQARAGVMEPFVVPALHSGQPGQVQVDLGLAGVVTGLLEQVQGTQAVRARVVELLEARAGEPEPAIRGGLADPVVQALRRGQARDVGGLLIQARWFASKRGSADIGSVSARRLEG